MVFGLLTSLELQNLRFIVSNCLYFIQHNDCHVTHTWVTGNVLLQLPSVICGLRSNFASRSSFSQMGDSAYKFNGGLLAWPLRNKKTSIINKKALNL